MEKRKNKATALLHVINQGPTIKGVDTSTSHIHVKEFDDALDEGLESDVEKLASREDDQDVRASLQSIIDDVKDGQDPGQAFEDAVDSLKGSKQKQLTKMLKPLVKKHKIQTEL